MISYKFSEINRIKYPCKYTYTPYLGPEFIHSYFFNRLKNIERFSAIKNIKNLTWIYLYIYAASVLKLKKDSELESFNYKDWDVECITSFNLKNKVSTEKLLISLIFNQLNDESVTKEWLDNLVQRFEVTKKIYEIYMPGFRKGAGKSDVVQLYWLFSLLLALFYSEVKNIKYLSTLLKVNDLLCSLGDNQIINIPVKGVELVLRYEIESIKSLSYDIMGDDLCI